MWERVAPVYMASPTASICETYRHSEQKPAQKFCGSKKGKNRGPHPLHPSKGRNRVRSVFWGGGGLYQGAGEAQRRPVPATNHKTVAAALVLRAGTPLFS